MDQWHLVRNGKQSGPYRFSALVEAVKRGALLKDDQIWRPGWDAWRPAHSVPELFVPPDGGRGPQTPKGDTHAVHQRPIGLLKIQQLSQQKVLPAFSNGWRNIMPSFFLRISRSNGSHAAVLKTSMHRDGW
jgi:GYF domain 2